MLVLLDGRWELSTETSGEFEMSGLGARLTLPERRGVLLTPLDGGGGDEFGFLRFLLTGCSSTDSPSESKTLRAIVVGWRLAFCLG